jgi:hypothetical protein
MFWELDLCMQYWDRVVVPFHHFVTPKPQLNVRATSPHFPFFRLPIDIQLLVYESCDGPTLFQLMRTCLRTRCSVTKLFWDNASRDYWYYCCRDEYLFEDCPPGYTLLRHCPKFAHQITSVEIDLTRLELRFRGDDDDTRTPASTATKARDFWAKFRNIFPSVQRVVLTGCEPRRIHPPPPGEVDEDYTIIETVVQRAPACHEVLIAFDAFPMLGEDRPRNTLWRAGSGVKPWQVIDADWKPTRVLLPHRRWAVSPLGDFLRFNQMYGAVLLEKRGIEWLMVESYARYAVQDIIRCPRLDCSATYTERGSWKRHLSVSGHGRFDIRCQYKKDPMSQLFCYKHTPEDEKKAIEARQRHMDNLYLDAAKIQRRVGHGWGPPGSKQRDLFEAEFTAQLKEESLGVPDENEMSPADDYINNLYLWFDRGHVYHGCSGTEDGHVCYEA